MRLLVTGGAGFIGSNFVHYWLERYPDDHVVVYDLLTYAGNRPSLSDVEDRIVFVQGDICDRDLARRCATSRSRSSSTLPAESPQQPGCRRPDAVLPHERPRDADAPRRLVGRRSNASTTSPPARCSVISRSTRRRSSRRSRRTARAPLQRLQGRGRPLPSAHTSRPSACRSRSPTARTTTAPTSSPRRCFRSSSRTRSTTSPSRCTRPRRTSASGCTYSTTAPRSTSSSGRGGTGRRTTSAPGSRRRSRRSRTSSSGSRASRRRSRRSCRTGRATTVATCSTRARSGPSSVEARSRVGGRSRRDGVLVRGEPCLVGASQGPRARRRDRARRRAGAECRASSGSASRSTSSAKRPSFSPPAGSARRSLGGCRCRCVRAHGAKATASPLRAGTGRPRPRDGRVLRPGAGAPSRSHGRSRLRAARLRCTAGTLSWSTRLAPRSRAPTRAWHEDDLVQEIARRPAGRAWYIVAEETLDMAAGDSDGPRWIEAAREAGGTVVSPDELRLSRAARLYAVAVHVGFGHSHDRRRRGRSRSARARRGGLPDRKPLRGGRRRGRRSHRRLRERPRGCARARMLAAESIAG